MQENFNRPADNFGEVQDQNKAELGIFHNAIIIQPQQLTRTYNQMMNSSQSGSKCNSNNRKFMHYAGTYGQSYRPWLKMPYYRDQNTRNSSDSVIINFNNINESSTSNSVNSYGHYIYKTSPESDQQNVASLESERSNQNLSDHVRECNIDISFHNDNNNNNDDDDDDDDNDNNNNNNNNNNSSNYFGDQNPNNQNDSSFIQNSEETQGENPNLSQNSRNQSVEKIFNKYIPFITFLSLKAIYDHREGILIFLGLLVTFIHANSVVKREIAKQSRRSLISLGIIFVNLFVSICFIYFVFQEQQLYKILIFIPPYSQPLNIWDVLWIVGITDFVLKFITIQLKVGMACFPAKLLPYSARGKWYLMLERASQLYRGLIPIQPWLYYLMEVYQGSENIVGMFFSVAYVVSKGSDIMSKIKLFSKAFWKLLHNASLGVHPSNEQLITAGSQCPICHDEYNSPIILQCKHIFCESCVSIWFDREQTCPLCRAKIADDPSWRDGATSLFTQLF